MSRTIIFIKLYVNFNIILDVSVTYKWFSALQISMRMSTSNNKHVSFLYLSNEKNYPKGRPLM